MISVKKKYGLKKLTGMFRMLIDRVNHINLMRGDIISLNIELKKFLNKNKKLCATKVRNVTHRNDMNSFFFF